MEPGVSLLHSNRRKSFPILRQINPNILSKQSRTPEKAWFFSLGSSVCKLTMLRRISRRSWTWTDHVVRQLCTPHQLLFGW